MSLAASVSIPGCKLLPDRTQDCSFSHCDEITDLLDEGDDTVELGTCLTVDRLNGEAEDGECMPGDLWGAGDCGTRNGELCIADKNLKYKI